MPVMTTDEQQQQPAGAVGLGFFVRGAREAVDLVRRAEGAGVDTAWMVMHPAGYDTPTLAAAALAVTARIRVGTSIVPAFTRHPVALATQAVALAELSPGRFRLGVGTSGMSLMADGFGTPLPRPVAAMGEYLDVLQSALRTGTVSHRGTSYTVELGLAAPPATDSGPMPVTLAALGPRMFRLAGERADAAMTWLCPLDYVEAVARPEVARGAAAAGRPVPPIVVHVTAVVARDRSEARRIARPTVAGFAGIPHFAAVFAGAGLPVAADGPSDALIDAVTVHGDEAGLTDRLGDLAERHDELLVTLEAAGDRRADEDVLLGALGNVTRILGRQVPTAAP
jgi:alkanesulfonate monooxygenase SsuD/methylene tetrahydromethanopterin reductase-like flavin-dependent oxidoreductase (luciferase family)